MGGMTSLGLVKTHGEDVERRPTLEEGGWEGCVRRRVKEMEIGR